MKRKGLKGVFGWLAHHRGLVASLLFLLLALPFALAHLGEMEPSLPVAAPPPESMAGNAKPPESEAQGEETAAANDDQSCPFVQNEKPGNGRPRIAIVIDDMGLDPHQSAAAMDLPPAVTLSFLPYAPHVQAQVDLARSKGHEIFLHMPMEAVGGSYPGPGTLETGLEEEELRRRIQRNLDSFWGYDGVNNHMGSLFTANAEGMRVLMQEMRVRNLIYLDSRTTAATVAEAAADEANVPFIRRHVFLDHEMDEKYKKEQLKRLERIAKDNDFAIAIGHPHPNTLAFIRNALPYLTSHYELVPAGTFASQPAKMR